MSSSQRNWRCSATDKAANYLGLMRKAGRMAVGEHDGGAAARAGKACLLLLAQDASDNARKRAEGFAHAAQAPLLRLPYTKQALSDRLTPWEKIEKRLLCAAEADLSIAIYNPASHGRPDHLKRACEILLRVLPEDRLCGVVRNIGREGQSRRVLTLGALKTAQIDMFCTVFIGNAATKLVADELVTPRGYRDV